MQTECGYLPGEIDALTLDDLGPLFRYWQKHPPLRELVHAIAVFLGAVKPPQESNPAQEPHRISIAEIKAFYPDGIIRG